MNARLAHDIGYPVIIKAAAGGGGRGMRVVHSDAALFNAVAITRAEALSAFANDQVYMEKFLDHPRHIEFQVLADSHGNAVHLGRARLLDAAAAPKGRRGSAGARHLRRRAPAHGPRRRRGVPGDRLPRRRHVRVPVSGRPVLLHRDEHARPGRASGHRARDGHRHRQGAARDRGRREARVRAGRRPLARPRDRVPDQRRGSEDVRAVARAP